MPIYEYKCAKCGYKTEKFLPQMNSNRIVKEKHKDPLGKGCNNERLYKMISKSSVFWKCDTGTS